MTVQRSRSLSTLLVMLAGCSSPMVGPDPVVDPTPEVPEEEVLPRRAPAALTLSVSASPMTVSVGQEILLEVTVHNGGEATAIGVVPTTPVLTGSGLAIVTTAPNPQDLEGGRSHRFSFVYTATDSGPLTFEVGAGGVDVENDQDVVAAPATAVVLIESAAMLLVESLEVPRSAVVGRDVTVTMTVTNGGQSAARAVVPDALTLGGTATATLVSGPVPAMLDLDRGTSKTFTWTYRAASRGTLTFSGGARGTDGNSAQPAVAEPIDSLAVTVETPAALVASLSVPANLTRGQSFVATMVVRNTGGATATGVLPDLPVAMTTSGTASATSTTTAAPTDLPGGGSAVFSWTFTASGTGAFSLSAGARGVDQVTTAPVTAPVVTSSVATVRAPAALVVTSLTLPTVVARGQPFDLTMVVQNTGTATVTDVLPTPAPPTQTSTGGVSAMTATTPAAQTLAAGASATFVWRYTESGGSVGTVSFTAAARGTAGGAPLTSALASSNLGVVVDAPALVVESVTVPQRVSRGQAFDAVVTVRNTGGMTITAVVPSLTVAATGAALATVVDPTPLTLAAGAARPFTFRVTETGTGTGTLLLSAVASGTDGSTGQLVRSVAVASRAITVQTAAALTVTAFRVPASVTRGASFAVSMTVSNAGEAAARNVVPLPSPPTATVTGGVRVSTASTATPVTIPGNGSQTFTWTFTESGTGPGTVAFSAGVQGLDANSGAMVAVPVQSSNSAPVAAPTGCNGSALYSGFGGRSLDGDRLDQAVGTNRLRVKPYAMLVTDYNRVLGVTPAAIVGQAATFNQAGPRWNIEPELSAVSMYQAFQASFQGCLTLTSTGTQFAANPTAATAATQCDALQRRFWARAPTAAETNACATFATSAVNNDTNPRRRWAYACAAVLTSTGFLTQ